MIFFAFRLNLLSCSVSSRTQQDKICGKNFAATPRFMIPACQKQQKLLILPYVENLLLPKLHRSIPSSRCQATASYSTRIFDYQNHQFFCIWNSTGRNPKCLDSVQTSVFPIMIFQNNQLDYLHQRLHRQHFTWREPLNRKKIDLFPQSVGFLMMQICKKSS